MVQQQTPNLCPADDLFQREGLFPREQELWGEGGDGERGSAARGGRLHKELHGNLQSKGSYLVLGLLLSEGQGSAVRKRDDKRPQLLSPSHKEAEAGLPVGLHLLRRQLDEDKQAHCWCDKRVSKEWFFNILFKYKILSFIYFLNERLDVFAWLFVMVPFEERPAWRIVDLRYLSPNDDEAFCS